MFLGCFRDVFVGMFQGFSRRDVLGMFRDVFGMFGMFRDVSGPF